MKKLTLDETWIQCLKMWRWIVRQPCPRHVGELKERWLNKNGFDSVLVLSNCFLCEYDDGRGCICCPGYIIDTYFNCENNEYHYYHKPAAFLRKITELNKKRLAKRRKR